MRLLQFGHRGALHESNNIVKTQSLGVTGHYGSGKEVSLQLRCVCDGTHCLQSGSVPVVEAYQLTVADRQVLRCSSPVLS